MKMPTPEKEHLWLQKLVGRWAYEFEAPSKPGEPQMKFEGIETVRPIGEIWIQGEQVGPLPDGSSSTALIHLGFDSQKKKIVGTWLGSMMTNLWVYEGSLDAAGKVLTLDTEGPDFSVEGKTGKYREVIEIQDDDHRTFTSFLKKDDGTWQEIMTMRHRRAQ